MFWKNINFNNDRTIQACYNEQAKRTYVLFAEEGDGSVNMFKYPNENDNNGACAGRHSHGGSDLFGRDGTLRSSSNDHAHSCDKNACGSNSTYMCIDLKSYYASVECVARGLDPLTANLLVADESRSDKTICLAVSPSLKAIGVPGRPRLFEAKQKIREYEIRTGKHIDYIVAVPRMAEYIKVSSKIYEIYRKFLCKDDIHVYSIDECFMDVTGYLHFYVAHSGGGNDLHSKFLPARRMALTMIREVLAETGITATAGIGTNLYLAKVGMDIVAKKAEPDKDGVRIAALDERSYKLLLWDHRPLTDFWMIGPGTARKLESHGMMTLGDAATMTLSNEELFYKLFGINAELLIDHIWGIEPCRMSDIKNYRSSSRSVSKGQVLPRPYAYEEARLVFAEMADDLAADLLLKSLVTDHLTFWISFDPKSLDAVPYYKGPLMIDFYGRLHPKYVSGSVRLGVCTNSRERIMRGLLSAFEEKVNRDFFIRRMGICANDTHSDDGIFQLDFFTDYEAMEKEQALQQAMLRVRQKYGPNAIIRGMNLLEGGTAMERNQQIGGHKA